MLLLLARIGREVLPEVFGLEDGADLDLGAASAWSALQPLDRFRLQLQDPAAFIVPDPTRAYSQTTKPQETEDSGFTPGPELTTYSYSLVRARSSTAPEALPFGCIV
jgi:hypothetical protein